MQNVKKSRERERERERERDVLEDYLKQSSHVRKVDFDDTNAFSVSKL